MQSLNIPARSPTDLGDIFYTHCGHQENVSIVAQRQRDFFLSWHGLNYPGDPTWPVTWMPWMWLLLVACCGSSYLVCLFLLKGRQKNSFNEDKKKETKEGIFRAPFFICRAECSHDYYRGGWGSNPILNFVWSSLLFIKKLFLR